MIAAEFSAALAELGRMWGFNRPMRYSEMGRALRRSCKRPDEAVSDWARGKSAISGPVSVAVDAMLAGYRPDEGKP
jgi:hypothetical protein